MSSLPPQSDLPRKDLSDISISPQTDALVEESMPAAQEQIKQETKALIETLKRRAQAEVQGAQKITVDTYLTAVRSAKEALEATRLFDPERIERSVALIQQEAQKNMQSILDEINQWSDRLAEAAKVAWETLTQSSSKPDA